MDTINCEKWEEFEERISAISQGRNEKNKNPNSISYISAPLFRGQASNAWKLETTLERFGKENFEMQEYYRIIRSVKPAVTSLIEKTWALGEYTSDEEGKFKPPPGYEFMVYLRHHGFPSPLIGPDHPMSQPSLLFGPNQMVRTRMLLFIHISKIVDRERVLPTLKLPWLALGLISQLTEDIFPNNVNIQFAKNALSRIMFIAHMRRHFKEIPKGKTN